MRSVSLGIAGVLCEDRVRLSFMDVTCYVTCVMKGCDWAISGNRNKPPPPPRRKSVLTRL